MKRFDNIVIGFGKGGKTLAAKLSKEGQSVALLERSDRMFGGTCINVACIPTKSLENSARLSDDMGGGFDARAERYREAVERKRELTASLRQKNYAKMEAAGVAVLVGAASFTGAHTVRLDLPDGQSEELYGERIFINTGARPFIPPIDGLLDSRYSYTSEQMMELDELPKRLMILGGGYIGMEFASIFCNFGSKVTVVQDGDAFLPREDTEIAEAVLESLEKRGVRVLRGTKTKSVRDAGGHADILLDTPAGEERLEAEAILIATGRRPELSGLYPEAAGIELTERGAVKVDEHLRTSVPHIFAMGDVAGGLQFTYISLDDSRIVASAVLGDGARTTENRGAVPYSVFLDPPFSRVGLSEAEAVKQGYTVKIARLPVAAIPKSQVLRKPDGLLKAVVDAETGHILGAHLFCVESYEMINQIKLAMDADLPYTVLRDAIYTHPTMSEAFNDLFAALA
ncbi:FAD-dependent oxidoreductase [Agathobaculum sp.]|uniref:FAD-dependent oxidoreductase n=1 Tax=Agathobaculum sp. TaxID=2048138 RepID=UPI002A80966C|nr:FAD-dependent oxidoreductase [Agathobaculum sp.]MDY3617743.1 FAD-dependent oxidoreductase [Agathobaculum sp.]